MGVIANINGVSALEMTMRDVLDGLEDFASDFAFAAGAPDTFEILAIEPVDAPWHRAAPPPPVREEPFIWLAPVIALSA